MKKGKGNENSGRKYDQKMKPFLVYQLLFHETDENHVKSGDQIATDLQATYDISAERRSIYRDIHEINKAILAVEENISLDEAEEMLYDDESLQTIVFDKHRKGFYMKQRKYDLDDIRILAECVYSARFVSESQAKRLVDVVCDFVSDKQAEKIKHNAFLVDRVKTHNKSVINNIAVINDATSRRRNGKEHIPKKITFKYLSYTIDNLSQQIERKHGDMYKVSPFALLINDGNYYLLACDEKGKLKTYRVDRMKNVSLSVEQREGEDVFNSIDLKTYTQRVFSMFGGDSEHVTIRFINPLLDTMVERFGINAVYSKVDDRHSSVTAKIEVSDQFYGWLLGFGKRVKLISPEPVVDKFKAYLNKVTEMYD